MQFASSVSDDASLTRAIETCAGSVHAQLDGSPDVAIAFVSEHHSQRYAELPALMAETLAPRHWIGCSAGGVIGGGCEVEKRPGFSLTAARLPGAEVRTFHVEPSAVDGSTAQGWRNLLGVDPGEAPGFVLLADPFTFDSEGLVRALDAVYPQAKKAGGLASGGRQPGGNALYADGALHTSGAVGLALTGDAEIDTVVAQGCRPIGTPMFVTRCERNLVQGLDGRSPYEVLADLYELLSSRDRELFQHSLFLGIVMQPEQQEYHQGDFLVRNIVGADPKSGVLAIGALLEPHMVVQFHLRDAQTSHDDLTAMLTRYRRGAEGEPSGALLFS